MIFAAWEATQKKAREKEQKRIEKALDQMIKDDSDLQDNPVVEKVLQIVRQSD